METRAAGGPQVVVERVVDQVVCEREQAGLLRALLKQRRVGGGFEQLDQLVLVGAVKRLVKELEVEVAADDGSAAQDRTARIAETLHPPSDHFTNTLWETQLVELLSQLPLTRRIHECARL